MNSIIEINQVSDIKPRKKKRFLKFVFSILVIAISAVFAVNYFIPGLLMSRDLGVRYTSADYKSALSKLEYTKDATPVGESSDLYNYSYGEPNKIDANFTSSEITAFLNSERPDYFAFKKIQVKLNSDNSVEATSTVDVDYLLKEVFNNSFGRDEIAKDIPSLGVLASSVNIYIHFDFTITDNTVEEHINSLSIQGINIPSKYTNANNATKFITNELNRYITNAIQQTGAYLYKVEIKNSQLLLDANIPSSLSRQEKTNNGKF